MRPETSGLQRFQDCFSRALTASATEPGDDLAHLAYLVSQSGFSVYRNTVMKGCIDALQANYPAVSRLVGEAWFRAAAAIFVRAANLPQQPTLLEYGDGFATFLAGFAPAAALPYLAGVARLDRYWTEAHLSRDEAPIEAAAVAGLDAMQLAGAVLTPHASARWAAFDDETIPAIWRRNRDADAAHDEPAIEWQAEGVLIVRPYDAVETLEIDAAGCAFLDACAQGRPLAEAAAASLEADPRTDLSRLMSRLLSAGAFCRLALPARIPQEDLP